MVEEVVETEQTETPPVTEQPTEAPVQEPEVKKEEQKEEPKEVVKEEPKELPKVLYPGTKDGQADEAKKANQGDKTEAVGDQGDKDGSVDARALYGEQGGGDGGPTIELFGWKWNNEPRPDHGDVKNGGKIEFEFKVDDKGNVFAVTLKSITTDTNLIPIYRDALERTTFARSVSGKPPPATNGSITFYIEAK